jgi:hypothetical protein
VGHAPEPAGDRPHGQQPGRIQYCRRQAQGKLGRAGGLLRSSKELENLLNIRETLATRGHSTAAVDKRIAVERMRIVRSDLDRATPARAATLEITAKRTNPQDQSAKIIYDDKGKAVGYIAPPTTYFGKPKMPPKAPVRNY